jgi:hypothetical protein
VATAEVLKLGTGGGLLRHSNEPSGCIKGSEFLDYMSMTISLSRKTLLYGVN